MHIIIQAKTLSVYRNCIWRQLPLTKHARGKSCLSKEITFVTYFTFNYFCVLMEKESRLYRNFGMDSYFHYHTGTIMSHICCWTIYNIFKWWQSSLYHALRWTYVTFMHMSYISQSHFKRNQTVFVVLTKSNKKYVQLVIKEEHIAIVWFFSGRRY